MYSSNRAYEGSVRVNGRTVKEVHHRGQTYIEGRKGTEYTLHFENNTPNRVLVIPSVDGLCVIDGKPAGASSPGFTVDPQGIIDIPGWMVDQATAAKFTFWPQDARGEKTYVEELSKSGATVDVGNQGLIGFLVIEEKVKRPIIHTSSPLRSRRINPNDPYSKGWYGSSASVNNVMLSASASSMSTENMGFHDADAGMGTKFGEATNFNTTTTTFERGSIGGEIVLEYDTLRGLKDRGVPVYHFKGTDKGYGKRSAFPAGHSGCTPPAGWKG